MWQVDKFLMVMSKWFINNFGQVILKIYIITESVTPKYLYYKYLSQLMEF